MSGLPVITQVHGDEKNPLYATTYGVGELSAMPSAMAATALSLESAEVPQMTAVLVCYRHSVSRLLDAEGKQVPLVLSDWNLFDRDYGRSRSAGTFGMHLPYCLPM